MNAHQVAKIFGCTPEQAAAQYAANAVALNKMASKATARGRKVNGYSAEQLGRMSDRMARKAVV